MKAQSKKIYKFKVGRKLSLDAIYDIQGLAGGDWWEKIGDDLSDQIKIVRDITITIIVEQENETL